MRSTLPVATLLALLAAGCGAADTAAPARASAAAKPCLPDGSGYLRAQLRGALNADLDWHDAQIRCEGGARPDGEGLRVSIAGPLPQSAGADAGRTLRFVFGIDGAASASDGSALPTNLTAIIEGGTVFATRGDDKCTTDRLQRRSVAPGAPRRSADGSASTDYRVDVRGFCLGPASTLDGTDRLLITTFDFAGLVALETP